MKAFLTGIGRTSQLLTIFVLALIVSGCLQATVEPAPTSTSNPTNTPLPTHTLLPRNTLVATRPSSTPETITAKVTARGLNVRTGPGVAYPRVGVVSQDTVFVLNGRNESGTWVQGREQTENLEGWLSASYAEIEGDVMTLPPIDVAPPPTPKPTVTGLPVTPTLVQAIPVTPAPVGSRMGDCLGNRLVNGGFEGSFSERGRGEISVAMGWHPWFKNQPGTGGLNYIPEYKPEDAQIHGMRRVHSGRFAQKWFTTFATHTAGILQQVSGIPARSRLVLTAWVQVWSDDTDNPATSDVPGNYRVSIGIDPFGGTDYSSPNIVWSEFNTFAYDAYKQLTVATIAQNNVVTVFLRGVPEFPVKHNDSYWDDVCLTVQQ